MTTYVKYYDNAQTGAPSLTGTTGSLIALLDAVLLNGYNLKTLDSIVVSNNVATCTVGAGHGYLAGDGRVITVAGCSGAWAVLNGEQTVASVVSASQFTFLAVGVSNGSATGTITTKVSPLGWTAPYSGTNLKAYKASDVVGSGCLLRVDDTNAYVARVIGCETMTNINTWSAKFPTEAQQAGGLYFTKHYGRDYAVNWFIVADSFAIHIMVATSWYSSWWYGGYFFGDFAPHSSNDVYKCMIFGDVSYAQLPTTQGASLFSKQNASGGQFIERSYTGAGTSVASSRYWPPTNMGYNNGFAYPSESGSMVFVSPVLVMQGGNIFRGTFPGLFCMMQNVNGSIANKTIINDVAGMSGSILVSIIGGAGYNDQPIASTAAFDLVGPWR